jgi:hypothetical protein
MPEGKRLVTVIGKGAPKALEPSDRWQNAENLTWWRYLDKPEDKAKQNPRRQQATGGS